MPAMIVRVHWPIGEEQLRQTHLMGDEELFAIESSEKSSNQALVALAAKDDRAPLLVVRAVAIQILNARVHSPEGTSAKDTCASNSPEASDELRRFQIERHRDVARNEKQLWIGAKIEQTIDVVLVRSFFRDIDFVARDEQRCVRTKRGDLHLNEPLLAALLEREDVVTFAVASRARDMFDFPGEALLTCTP